MLISSSRKIKFDVFHFYGCEITSNGLGGSGAGIIGRSVGRGVIDVVGCTITDNAEQGIAFGIYGNIKS